ncbi:MAG: PKD domain-containing protein [Bacteroidia bacterium]
MKTYLSFPTVKSSVLFILSKFLITFSNPVSAQICDPSVPIYNVNLTGNPNGTWISPSVARNGNCCGTNNPDKCIQFNVILDPAAQGILFSVYSGAMPPGALFYQVNCGPPTPVGTPLCLNGQGPHIITFCKPGNNQNQYQITSIGQPEVSPPISLNDGCSGQIFANNLVESSIVWTSVYPGATGAYNHYLNCASACDTVTVTGQPGFPPYIDYQVCGVPIGGCSNMIFCDTVRVYFNPTLGAQIQPQNPTVCFGMSGTTITAIGSGGTPPYSYLWSNGQTSQSIFVGPGTYTVQISDTSNCPPVTASITVSQFTSEITANAGADIIICSDNAIAQLNGQITAAGGAVWTGGTGTFIPNNTALNAQYIPSLSEINSGYVNLILTTTGNGTCPPANDTVLISVAPSIIINQINIQQITCNGANNGQISITTNPVSGNVNYVWNTNPPQYGSTISALSPGNYSVTISNQFGCDTALTFTITQPPVLNASISSLQNVSCFGGSDGAISINANGGTPPYTYNWIPAVSFNNVATSISAGNYQIQVSDANGCVQNLTAQLTQPSQLSAAANISHVSCFGQNNGQIIVNVSGGVVPYQYQWSNTTLNTPNNSNLPEGNYTLQITDANGCILNQAYQIYQPSQLVLSHQINHVSCNGGNNGSATILASGGIFPYQYFWNTVPLQSNPTAVNLSAGNYQSTVIDANGCVQSMNITINQPDSLALNTVTTDALCFGQNSGSAAVYVNGGVAPYSYLWSNNVQTSNNNNLLAGAYSVLVTDANGCTANAFVQINQPSALIAIADPDVTVCIGLPATLSASYSGGTGNVNLIWSNGLGAGTTHQVIVGQQTTYGVYAIDENGCTSPADSITVNVIDIAQVNIVTSNDTDICIGSSTNIFASYTAPPGNYFINWSNNLGNNLGPHTVSPQENTTYYISVTNECNNTKTDSVIIRVRPYPTVNLNPDLGKGCAPLLVNLSNQSVNEEGTSYFWDFGDGYTSFQQNPSHYYSEPGTYKVTLTLTSPYGCVSKNQGLSLVQAFPSPKAAFEPDKKIASEFNPTIRFSNFSYGASAYYWSFGDGDTSTLEHPVHTYKKTGEYEIILNVQNTYGCSHTSSGKIEIRPEFAFYIPNTFTPNGDGKNETFIPKGIGYKEDSFRMLIFNRWGEMIFESRSMDHHWNGTVNGSAEPAQNDTYIYKIMVEDIFGKKHEYVGHVNIVK